MPEVVVSGDIAAGATSAAPTCSWDRMVEPARSWAGWVPAGAAGLAPAGPAMAGAAAPAATASNAARRAELRDRNATGSSSWDAAPREARRGREIGGTPLIVHNLH